MQHSKFKNVNEMKIKYKAYVTDHLWPRFSKHMKRRKFSFAHWKQNYYWNFEIKRNAIFCLQWNWMLIEWMNYSFFLKNIYFSRKQFHEWNLRGVDVAPGDVAGSLKGVVIVLLLLFTWLGVNVPPSDGQEELAGDAVSERPGWGLSPLCCWRTDWLRSVKLGDPV